MKTIKVKTIYDHQVSFPEKFYAPNNRVQVGKEFMSLKGKTPTGHSEWFDDKFGRGKYRLVYFSWNPDELTPKQKKLQEAEAKYQAMTPEERFYNY